MREKKTEAVSTLSNLTADSPLRIKWMKFIIRDSRTAPSPREHAFWRQLSSEYVDYNLELCFSVLASSSSTSKYHSQFNTRQHSSAK